jgi:pyruvate/2-oxoglutarate/acetoin dehydrogenase E1 component
MYDDLMENDPEMRRLREKYKTEGLAEGEAKGRRVTILTIVNMRFPSLREQAQLHVAQVSDVDDLQELLEQLVSTSDEKTARALLTSANPN